MEDAADTYAALGRALARLNDPSFAQTQGFLGGPKVARQLRRMHERAASLQAAALGNLGRIIGDNVSPSSESSTLFSKLYESLNA